MSLTLSIIIYLIATIIGYVVFYYFYNKYLKETNNEKLFKPWEKIIHLIVVSFLAGIVSLILIYFIKLSLYPSELNDKSTQSGIQIVNVIIGFIFMYIFLWLLLKYKGINGKIASKIANSTVSSTFITLLIGGIIFNSLIVGIILSLLSYPKI